MFNELIMISLTFNCKIGILSNLNLVWDLVEFYSEIPEFLENKYLVRMQKFLKGFVIFLYYWNVNVYDCICILSDLEVLPLYAAFAVELNACVECTAHAYVASVYF